MPRDPTPTNRGTPSGTLTRTKRCSLRRSADHDRGDVQRERRDVRERRRRTNRDRSQQRRDLTIEPLGQGAPLPRRALVDRYDANAFGRKRRPKDVEPQRVLVRLQGQHTLSRLLESLLRRASIGRRALDPGLDLFAGAGHPHREELVEVRRGDPAQLHAFEQRDAGVCRELEHPPVEVEPRQLTVEEPIGRRCSRSRLAQRAKQRVACSRDRYIPSSAVIRPSRTALTTTL